MTTELVIAPTKHSISPSTSFLPAQQKGTALQMLTHLLKISQYYFDLKKCCLELKLVK